MSDEQELGHTAFCLVGVARRLATLHTGEVEIRADDLVAE